MSAPGPGTRCPRCGRAAPPGSGSFCVHCGRHLGAPGGWAALQWIAHPPFLRPAGPPVRQHRPYAGPPRYRVQPRGGLPVGPWPRHSPDERSRRAGPLAAARSAAVVAVPLLWATAAVACVAAGAEVWRYVLLVLSLDGALDAGVVGISDALVGAAGRIAPVLGVLAGIGVVLWTVRAVRSAADSAGVRPSRRPYHLVLGWIVPVVNIAVPGAVLAELEHTALGLPPHRRPRPSRLLWAWWALWTASVVLTVVVLLWGLRPGIQAQADGVLLHALLDLLAAATAAVTALLLTRITAWLAPPSTERREVLVAVGGPGSRATPPGAGERLLARLRRGGPGDQTDSRSSLSPRMTKSGRRTGGEASESSGSADDSASSDAEISSLASGAPRQ